MTSPTFANRSSAITNSGLRAERIAVTPTPLSPASCEIGPMVASPTPRPSTTMFFHSGCSEKPTPSGPTMLSSSPGSSVASPRVPRPTHL